MTAGASNYEGDSDSIFTLSDNLNGVPERLTMKIRGLTQRLTEHQQRGRS